MIIVTKKSNMAFSWVIGLWTDMVQDFSVLQAAKQVIYVH